MARGVAALLLFSLLVPGPFGCESDEAPARAPRAESGEEVFEAFDSGAIIEEETIAAPPAPVPVTPAPLGDTSPEEKRRPLSSPGAAPPGAAPMQPPAAE